MRGRRGFGWVVATGAVAALTMTMMTLVASAEALPHEDRAVLRSSVASSASNPRVVAPGRTTTVVVTNIGRTPTKALRARLVEGPGAQEFQVLFDSCTWKRLRPRRTCSVQVAYSASAAPEAAATAVLRVAARGKRKVATSTYFRVGPRARIAPTATGEAFSLGRNGSLSAGAPGVLGNDRDPDGRALTAELVEGVKHGTLTLRADGSFAYRPEADYVGPDAFVYRAVDADGLGALATVSITVAGSNRAPVAADDTGAVTEDAAPGTVSGNLLANDTDADGDPLAVTTTGASPIAHGALAIQADGSWTYTLDSADPAVDALDAGQHLVDTFTYVVSDGHGGTATATLTVTIDGATG